MCERETERETEREERETDRERRDGVGVNFVSNSSK